MCSKPGANFLASMTDGINTQITLPSPGNFHRTSTIPFYVVFTTVPRSSMLARDIAGRASISVGLIRQVTISTAASLPPTPPVTPPSSAEDSGYPSSSRRTHRRLFSRVVSRSAPTILLGASRIPEEPMEKPLPRVPSAGTIPLSENRTLLTDVYKGFPKRPRNHGDGPQSSRADPDGSLPDGLYKGKMRLNKNMLPGIDWPGVSVKVCGLFQHTLLPREELMICIQYYLDVTVLFRRDKASARIPIRIY